MRILLAEDNETNRKVAAKMAASLGHSVEVVEDGAAAVRRALEGAFDVVLMDVQMPELDGLEATRRIRAALGRRGGPRIIAVTANALLGDRETCLEAGMDDYLAKPLRLGALRRALEAVAGAEEGGHGGGGSLLDEEQLLGVIDAADPECVEIFDEFCAGVPAALDAIGGAVKASDWEAAAGRAHQLKGSAATMGFTALADWAAKVETLARSGGLTLPERWRVALEGQFSEARLRAGEALSDAGAQAPR